MARFLWGDAVAPFINCPFVLGIVFSWYNQFVSHVNKIGISAKPRIFVVVSVDDIIHLLPYLLRRGMRVFLTMRERLLSNFPEAITAFYMVLASCSMGFFLAFPVGFLVVLFMVLFVVLLVVFEVAWLVLRLACAMARREDGRKNYVS